MTAYVLNDFDESLRSFFREHAELNVQLKLPTINQHVNGHVRFYTPKDLKELVARLKESSTAIAHCSCSADYVSIWLKKDVWTASAMREILTSGRDYGTNELYKGKIVSVSTDVCDDSVTSLRITFLKNAIENLAKISGCVVGESRGNGLNLFLSRTNRSEYANLLFCERVVCDRSVQEYKLRKQNNIAKMSANRIETNEYPIDIVSKLCHISVIYELLNVRHGKLINIPFYTSTKDNGIFIMYNYSRLYQIWMAYEKGVAKNHYKSLPDLEAVNFGLLTSEEEWFLVLKFLSDCPLVIQKSVKYLMTACVEVHRLCKFLMKMSSAVSLFYHRHHVLVDPIESSLPLMYARLYLVKALIQVYENIFELLGIEAVREM